MFECDNIIDLGCVGHCDNIILPEAAFKFGTIQVEFKRGSARGYFDMAIKPMDNNIVINASHFNENAETLFRIVDENDSEKGIVRNWYRIKTILKYNHNEQLSDTNNFSGSLRC